MSKDNVDIHTELAGCTYGMLLVTDDGDAAALMMAWSLDDVEAFVKSDDSPVPMDPPNAAVIIKSESDMFDVMDHLTMICIYNIDTLGWDMFSRPDCYTRPTTPITTEV